jgi:hypothetical protein
LRTVEKLAAAALSEKLAHISVGQVLDELWPGDGPRLH